MIINPWILIGISLIYIGILFGIAYRGDRRSREKSRSKSRYIYALSLAAYCTTWSFYGSVGSATIYGWSYLPIYLGPMITLLFFSPVLRKILLIAKQQNTTSIADFIAARYGKSQSLAALVAVICLLVIVPYIALQLDALSMAFNMLTRGLDSHSAPITLFINWHDTGLLVAVTMAIFAIAFGTRHTNPRESQQGIMHAIAFESVVKLGAFFLIGFFVLYGLFNGAGDLLTQSRGSPHFQSLFHQKLLTPHFLTILLLTIAAPLCLPRQFHISVVENTQVRDLQTARWLFPLYIFAMSLFVLPITAAGLILFRHDSLNPDYFVLALSSLASQPSLALIVYIGGLSAATSMVIMATVTLATMLCNELIIPLIMRLPGVIFSRYQDLTRALLVTRRILIIAILTLAWLFYRLLASHQMLADIGLLSLSGIVTLLPPLIGGIFIRRITCRGVFIGLCVGFLIWAYTLVVPVLVAQGWLPGGWLANGPLGVVWLAPQGLFSTQLDNPLTHGVIWTLSGEMLTMLAVSMNTNSSLIERAQAAAFVELGARRASRSKVTPRPATIRINELEVVLQRFLGPQDARSTLYEYAQQHDRRLHASQIADDDLLQFAEQRLAGIVGSASARLMMASGLRQRDLAMEDMVRLLDRTADAVQFNRSILQAALENIDQGISVIDKDLRLVAWNSRYTELFEYPPGMIRAGRHIADIIRFNAMRGECGPGSVEEHVRKRLGHLRAAKPHSFQRYRRNNTVLQMTGNPMPGGGFVTTFSDVTEFKRNEEALKRMNEELEARVAHRTEELSRTNQDLRRENEQRAKAQRAELDARQEAERANLSKTRFLAAASHDLLQPLNAARLFAAGAENGTHDEQHAALKQIQMSLGSAQSLLEPLLDISKIDAGAWDVNYQDFPLARVLKPLIDEFTVLAGNAGLALHAVPSSTWVRSDPNLLRRILQNLLSNAVRYTQSGRLLLGARRQAQQVRIEVWDTGPGISQDQLQTIFEEFQRGASSHTANERGLGLGLSLAERMAKLLGHDITVDSTPGRGTVFRIHVERIAAESQPAQQPKAAAPVHTALCIDDNAASLDALVNLLEAWHIDCITAPPEDAKAILNDMSFDIAIFDHDLGQDRDNGLTWIKTLEPQFAQTRFILVTANRSQEILTQAQELDIGVVYKPIDPDRLAKTLDSDGHMEEVDLV